MGTKNRPCDKEASDLIRNNTIDCLKQFLETPDDLVTLRMATKAVKMMTALLISEQKQEEEK